MTRKLVRPRKEAASISLFPFMDVFLCIMGALILMFIIIAQTPGEVVVRAYASAAGAMAPRAADLRPELEAKIKTLRAGCDQANQELTQRRGRLTALDEHARELRGRLAESDQAVGQLDAAAGSEDAETTALRAEHAQVESRIAVAKKEFVKTLVNPDQKSYAIIPFEGPNHTHRRPIYIECRSDSVVVQPEGVVLVEADFELPGKDNPLAATLKAAREYLRVKAAREVEQSGEPYPLLLVRPDGIAAYHVARAAISGRGFEFGYEFIDADWKIEYQPPDPNLALAMNQAVNSARDRPMRLAQAAPSLLTQKERDAMRAAGYFDENDRSTPAGNRSSRGQGAGRGRGSPGVGGGVYDTPDAASAGQVAGVPGGGSGSGNGSGPGGGNMSGGMGPGGTGPGGTGPGGGNGAGNPYALAGASAGGGYGGVGAGGNGPGVGGRYAGGYPGTTAPGYGPGYGQPGAGGRYPGGGLAGQPGNGGMPGGMPGQSPGGAGAGGTSNGGPRGGPYSSAGGGSLASAGGGGSGAAGNGVGLGTPGSAPGGNEFGYSQLSGVGGPGGAGSPGFPGGPGSGTGQYAGGGYGPGAAAGGGSPGAGGSPGTGGPPGTAGSGLPSGYSLAGGGTGGAYGSGGGDPAAGVQNGIYGGGAAGSASPGVDALAGGGMSGAYGSGGGPAAGMQSGIYGGGAGGAYGGGGGSAAGQQNGVYGGGGSGSAAVGGAYGSAGPYGNGGPASGGGNGGAGGGGSASSSGGYAGGTAAAGVSSGGSGANSTGSSGGTGGTTAGAGSSSGNSDPSAAASSGGSTAGGGGSPSMGMPGGGGGSPSLGSGSPGGMGLAMPNINLSSDTQANTSNAQSSAASADPPDNTDTTKPGNFSGKHYAKGQAGGSSSSSSGSAESGGVDPGGEPADSSAPSVSRDFGKTPKSSSSHGRRRFTEQSRTLVSITRPIKLECYADRLVLVSDDGDASNNKVIPLSGFARDAVDRLETDIHDRIGSWGMAGRGMQWHPIVVVHVAPDAGERFAAVQRMLKGDGLEVRDKNAPAAKTPAP